MLKIKRNPRKKPAEDVTFESPSTLKQNGVEMLIALNTTDKTVLTGPEVGIDAKILVTKEKPHFFYNPTIVLDSKHLQNDPKDYTIRISYKNYQDKEFQVRIIDEAGAIWSAIDQLHNGIARANKRKV
jgi:hypothetical protein